MRYSVIERAWIFSLGTRIVPDGRFGSGLRLTGKNGLRVNIGRAGPDSLASMEGWFKPDRLPDETVTLFDAGPHASRLVLHPDGHLELFFRYTSNRHTETRHENDLLSIRSVESVIKAPDSLMKIVSCFSPAPRFVMRRSMELLTKYALPDPLTMYDGNYPDVRQITIEEIRCKAPARTWF